MLKNQIYVFILVNLLFGEFYHKFFLFLESSWNYKFCISSTTYVKEFFFTLKCDFVQFNILNSGEMTINTMSINIDSLENKMKMLGVENRTNCPALENV